MTASVDSYVAGHLKFTSHVDQRRAIGDFMVTDSDMFSSRRLLCCYATRRESDQW